MNNTLVPNELLSFLQQKLDVMTELSAIQICSTNFSEEDIAAAKLLLFTTLNKRDQMVSRRRDGTKKSLQDIISLLKVTDPDDVPTFVARDLNKLPPVTFDHVDVTSLLKDIVLLKASLKDVNEKLEASQKDVSILRNELNELRNSGTFSGTVTCVNNVNTRRGAALDTSNVSFASAVLSSPQRVVETAECAVRSPRTPAPSPVTPARNSVPAKRPSGPPTPVSVPAATSNKPPPVKKATRAYNIAKEERGDEDGFIKVVKKKRKPTRKNQCGTALTGENHLLRPAVHTTQLYVSRLHYSTKAEEIVEYIRVKTNYKLRVVRLESRRNVNFNSFVVRVPTAELSTFTDVEFWPRGVVFRKFRGTLQDNAQHTSPTSRV